MLKYVKFKIGDNMIYLIWAILTSFSFFSEIVIKEIILTLGTTNINFNSFAEFNYHNTYFLLFFFLTIALYIFYKKYYHKTKNYTILSLFFSLCLVIGYSYSVGGSLSLIYNNIPLILISILKFIMFYVFIKTLLNTITSYIKKKDFSKIKLPKTLSKFKSYYELHPYKTSILILLICWLPYIISFYPAILSPDPSNQIREYYGIKTKYINDVILVDENVLITNHHPVFHTFILGGFTKIGDILGNINLGLFMFTCFQIFFLVSAIAYSLIYMKNNGISFGYRMIILLIFSLVPVFSLYALSSVKDTIFGALLIFYIIEFHKLINNKRYSWLNYMILMLLMLLMMLIRNNGIYIVIISFITLIFMVKTKKLLLLLVLISSLSLYTLHNNILLRVMHITPGSIKEMLSVPFQGTARLAKYYPESFSDDDKKIIDKILGFSTLGERYKPNISDPVKDEFNPYTTKEDLKEYLKVWGKGFVNHPLVYINATLNTCYGYLYPNTSNWYVYYEYDTRLKNSNIDYHYNSLDNVRSVLSTYGIIFPYIPLIGSIVNIGCIVWTYLYLFASLVLERKKELICLLIPAITLVLTCLVGPVNTYFRYMFPILVSLPLILGLVIHKIKT